MQTPDRFSAAVKSALELELPMLRPAVVRSRFDFRETARPGELVRALDDIRHRGSSGVILKAPDEPEISEAIGRLHDAGIPVVTLVTDIPLEPAGRLCRHRQPGGRRDRGIPHGPVAAPQTTRPS